MNVTFSHYEDIADGIRTLWFVPEKKVRYQAGQYTELYLPHDNPDNRGIHRWFTLSSSPTEPLLGITTSFTKNSSSYKKVLASLSPGSQLKLADPMGDFVVPKDKSMPLLFAAAGLGITPVRSIVKYLIDSSERRNIQVIHAVSQSQKLAFNQLFKASNIQQYTPWIKSETGALTALQILENYKHAQKNGLIYISGPEPLVEELNRELLDLGVDARSIVPDFYPGYSLSY